MKVKTRKQRWNIKRTCKILQRTFENKTSWEYGGRRNRTKSWQETSSNNSRRKSRPEIITTTEIIKAVKGMKNKKAGD